MNLDDNKYFLESNQLPDDKDSEYNYEEIPIDDFGIPEIDEDLAATVRVLQEATEDDRAADPKEDHPRVNLQTRPPAIDDFVRSFLLKLGMTRSLDCFQIEWFEKLQKGQLNPEDVSEVPDIYVRNQELDNELKQLREDRDKYKTAAMRAREMYIKLRNERDFHRLHHRRVAQEKNKLLNDIKRLKQHYASYEPALQQLRRKYEVAMKEKMLSLLERDRAVGQVHGLRSTLKSLEQFRAPPGSASASGGSSRAVSAGQMSSIHPCNRGGVLPVDEEGHGPSQKMLVEERRRAEAARDVANQMDQQRHPKDHDFPPDSGINPSLAKSKAPPSHLTRTGGFKLQSTVKAHDSAISGLALHPDKGVLCTTGDDHCWKLWSVPAGELLMTGTGHTDWVSGADFHPEGTQLATGSGDFTVKVWDFKRAECVHTFAEHSQAVWSVGWHWTGHFLASAGMDNTVRLWDLGSLRCRGTLRGHADSVNSVQFLTHSNTLLTASADKTIGLWDARTKLCGQIFYGHQHSINHAAFNPRGDTIVSCDSFGFVRFWDVRAGAGIAALDLGPHPSNHATFDMSGACVAVASNDGNIKVIEAANYKVSSLVGHEDAVQACLFEQNGEFLVSGGSDLTIRFWM